MPDEIALQPVPEFEGDHPAVKKANKCVRAINALIRKVRRLGGGGQGYPVQIIALTIDTKTQVVTLRKMNVYSNSIGEAITSDQQLR